jgi:hypothetical protein
VDPQYASETENKIHTSADNSSKILQQISKMLNEKSRIENRHTEEKNWAQKYHQETEMNITWNGVHERLKQKMRETNQGKKSEKRNSKCIKARMQGKTKRGKKKERGKKRGKQHE